MVNKKLSLGPAGKMVLVEYVSTCFQKALNDPHSLSPPIYVYAQ
jgi:hypothetical protein